MAPKYLPIAGIFVGAIGGAVFWLAAQLWPSSVAVVLSLSAITLVARFADGDSPATVKPTWLDIFVLLIQYNTLMALTAAKLPFPVPADIALGLIMVCGQAASHALLVSVPSARAEIPPHLSIGDLIFALTAGFTPAAMLGIPGLAGLVAAIGLRLGLATVMNRRSGQPPRALMPRMQPLAEACFYLGALATWKYV